jgi:hypothetical protein
MATNYEKIEIITRNKPPDDYTGPSSHKGQLYLDSSSGKWYRSLSAGNNVEWEEVFIGVKDPALFNEE